MQNDSIPTKQPGPHGRPISGKLTGLILDEIAPLIAGNRRQWAARCHANGLSITHLQVLTTLETDGPTPMSRLAEILDIGLPNATGIVGRMEERGVVERVHHPGDRRVVLAQLTPAGAQLIRDLEAVRRTELAAVIDTLSAAQQATLLRAVRDVRAALEPLARVRSPRRSSDA